MARPRFSQLPELRQREILDLAAEEFARSGFAGTSYNKLLERLGLGKGSAYYYFESKWDLFATAVVACYSSYFEALGEQPPPASAAEFWPYVFRSSHLGFEFMLSDPRAAGLMRCMQGEPELMTALVSDEVLSTLAAPYRELLGRGQELGVVRLDLPADLLVLIVQGLAASLDQWFVVASRKGQADPRWAAETFVDLAKRLLEPRA